MKSRARTTVSALRGVLGPLTGSEQGFAGVTGLSPSWVNKASYGKINITPKAAHKISASTGVSVDWLLQGNPSIPPVEADNRTPYSRESYEKHSLKLTASTGTTPGGVAQALVSVLGSISASMRQGEGLSAMNDLAEFTKLMAGKYARGHNLPDRPSIESLLHEALKVNRWMALDREFQVDDGD